MFSEQLQLLVKLQDNDLKIQKLEFLRKKIPIELEKLRDNCRLLERELEDVKEEINKLEKDRRMKEREIEAKKEDAIKRKKRLMEIKTNREYSAVLTEIDSVNKIISEFEEEVLAIMEKIEERKNDLNKKGELLKREMEDVDKIEDEKKTELIKLEEKLSQFKLRREHISKDLDENLLKNYNRISQVRKGLAVVPIVDNICQGCHMTVIPQTVAEIKRNNKIIICLHCSRILYWQKGTVSKEASLPAQ